MFSFLPVAVQRFGSQLCLSLIKMKPQFAILNSVSSTQKQSRGQNYSHHRAPSARAEKPQTNLFPFTALPTCHGPGILRTHVRRTHACVHKHKPSRRVSGECAESSGLLFSPQDVYSWDHQASSFTAGAGKPRHTQRASKHS